MTGTDIKAITSLPIYTMYISQHSQQTCHNRNNNIIGNLAFSANWHLIRTPINHAAILHMVQYSELEIEFLKVIW